MDRPGPPEAPASFEAHPDSYRHWKLDFGGELATLSMDVDEAAPLRPGYALKLNSYDLAVDLELADAIQRIRFGHPEVKAVVIRSLQDRIFCAGANIFMLATSSHPFKVNFCKLTNETRLSIEDASASSRISFLAALGGTASGGGYELALACDEIALIDDGNSAVSFPEVPLLGVLPGTGGLTRLVDKRKVRRDRADFFSTTAEGIKGRRALEWGLVDHVVPKSRFAQAIEERARALAKRSDRQAGEPGWELPAVDQRFVHLELLTPRRARLRIDGPPEDPPASPAELQARGPTAWGLHAFRELDQALLKLRFTLPEVATVAITTRGDPKKVLGWDDFIARHREHWLVREVLHHQKRVLKRLDLTSKTFFALIEPGSCFVGALAELVLAADRSYARDAEGASPIQLTDLNAGLLPMSNGLSRLEVKWLAEPQRAKELFSIRDPFTPKQAVAAGLVTFAPDDLDWDDELRVALEERESLSPDALTGMEANLRFAGPETLETKIFGRLSAWQNWVFQRPNAVGEHGALSLYGQAGRRPSFDLRRT